ncbi:hypothetical protein F511_01190 [Dorcoceras hygrometricum]|uniref:Transmembrane protein n=1 Tax=Dorcoceras hygrometricum TaxID=472368 RepID=A0A2Z7BRS0_9LAMI|nr:hypothetical protein F511_01190 [Dorcoceras hygrometricum]
MSKKICRNTCLTIPQCLSFLLAAFSFLSIPGSAEISSSSSSTDEKTSENNKSSRSSTTLIILISFLGLLAVVAFSVYLYKLWQKKKREEQHARLLKLFEQDDDLEVELGIRD